MSVWNKARPALSLNIVGLEVICDGVGVGVVGRSSFSPLFSDSEESPVLPRALRRVLRF